MRSEKLIHHWTRVNKMNWSFFSDSFSNTFAFMKMKCVIYDAFIDSSYSYISFLPRKIKIPNEIWYKLAHHLDVLEFIFTSEWTKWTNNMIRCFKTSSYDGSTGNVFSSHFRLNMFLIMHLYVLNFDILGIWQIRIQSLLHFNCFSYTVMIVKGLC